MKSLIQTEFLKFKRSRILYISIFGVLIISATVLLQGQHIFYGEKYADKSGWLITAALSLGSFYILPPLFALIGSYSISREYQDGTMKELAIIPVRGKELIVSKLIVSFTFCIFLTLLLFVLELFTEVILYTNKLTILEMIRYLKQYFLQGIALFFAITPLIAIVTIFRKGYWLSVIFAMIYSFAGVFTSQSQMFKSIYPISASFCFSGFYDVSGMQFMIACISLIISLLIAGIILRSARVYRME